MIVNEELVAQIVEKVLTELAIKDKHSNHRKLSISNNKKIEKDEISYLNYDENTVYDEVLIDKLSLEECARIIYNIRHKDKINFILDNYHKLQMRILEIENCDDGLNKIYQEILIRKGFVFEKQIEKKKEVMKSNKKVINERDLIEMKIKHNSKLTFSKKTIITPLAKDYLRKNKITIVEED